MSSRYQIFIYQARYHVQSVLQPLLVMFRICNLHWIDTVMLFEFVTLIVGIAIVIRWIDFVLDNAVFLPGSRGQDGVRMSYVVEMHAGQFRNRCKLLDGGLSPLAYFWAARIKEFVIWHIRWFVNGRFSFCVYVVPICVFFHDLFDHARH